MMPTHRTPSTPNHTALQPPARFAFKAALTLTITALMLLQSPPSAAGAAPPLMLANSYRTGVALQDYWVSEKYDGVRAYWDGKQLQTRGGEPIAAPGWFTAGWPATPMDGELWAGRGRFSHAVSAARRQSAEAASLAAWRGMRFMVFDLPAEPGTFDHRLPVLRALVKKLDQLWVQGVQQVKVADNAALQAMLQKTVRGGGEGLMLHRGDSLYRGERNDDLLKLKTHEDAEARVVAHLPGKGKYAGMTGALLVEMPATRERPALRFRIGAGLKDEQRRHPPPLGSLVTYRFLGVTDAGVPRFATFVRVREDLPASTGAAATGALADRRALAGLTNSMPIASAAISAASGGTASSRTQSAK